MADTLTRQERSERMRRIRAENTKPEWLVRRMLHNAGYRYKLHRRSLPGKPDLVFPSRKTAIFVHGCFWHQHQGCKVAHTPKSRSEYWEEKFRRNVERDAANEAALKSMGWRVIVVWECETADSESLLLRLAEELRPPTD